MNGLVILRFRDLVTEQGGTISEHKRVLSRLGHVWWGWWMRQWETPPYDLFQEILDEIREGSGEQRAFLFDSGQQMLWECVIADLRIAPMGQTIGPPELDAAPSYYQRGSYPAWLKISSVDDQPMTAMPENWTYLEFPTNDRESRHKELIDSPIGSLDNLRKTDATLWRVTEK